MHTNNLRGKIVLVIDAGSGLGEATARAFAAQVPPNSAIQEVIITPMTDTSWP